MEDVTLETVGEAGDKMKEALNVRGMQQVQVY